MQVNTRYLCFVFPQEVNLLNMKKMSCKMTKVLGLKKHIKNNNNMINEGTFVCSGLHLSCHAGSQSFRQQRLWPWNREASYSQGMCVSRSVYGCVCVCMHMYRLYVYCVYLC